MCWGLNIMNNLKETLEIELDEVLQQPLNKKKYYHYRSIDNFLFYLDQIENKDEKEKIFSILYEYLEILKTTIIDRGESITLFNKYIRPVGKFYEKSFHFMPVFGVLAAGFWILLFSLIQYMFKLTPLFYLFTVLPILLYYLYCLRKTLDKKVYGLMW